MKSSFTLLKNAGSFYKDNVSLLSRIYIVPYLVLFLAVALLIGTGIGSSFIENKNIGVTVFMTAVFFLLLPVVLLQVLSTIGLIKAIADPIQTTVRSAYASSTKYIWQYILLAIMLTLVIALGLLLLIIPGIIFAFWFAFAYYILILEDKKAIDALKASKAYVKGNFWQVCKKTVFFGFVYFLITAVCMAPLVLILGDESVVIDIVDAIITFVMVPISLTYFYLVYLELKNTSVAQTTIVE